MRCTPVNAAVLLSHSVMIDKFRKLVAVAEEMATEWNNAGDCVEGMDVQVQGSRGVVRVGVMREYPVYFPDENVYMPEYGVDYIDYYYNWVDGEWVREFPKPAIVSMVDPFVVEDPLPF